MKDFQILNTRTEVDVCEREHVSAETADKVQDLQDPQEAGSVKCCLAEE